jgi:hypothetical protein
MKYDMAYKHFRHFRKDKIIMDFAFFTIVFNLKKLCARIKRTGLKGLSSFFYRMEKLVLTCLRQKILQLIMCDGKIAA